MLPRRPLNEVYRAAAELLSCRGLAKHAMARNGDGRAVNLEDEAAVAYCAWGALTIASGGPESYPRWPELEAPLKEVGLGMLLETWSDLDRTTAQDVVALFLRAAALLEAGKSKTGPTGRPRLGPKPR